MIEKIDVQNFLEVFRKFNGQIFGYVYLRVARDRSVAEDLTQEIFIKAWQNRAKFDATKASIKTWIYTIAHNNVIDYWRRNKPQPVDLSHSEEIANDTTTQVENEILSKYVQSQIYKLEQLDQDLITWRYIQELEIEEIAIITNKNYNTTKVAIHRALQKLKQLINQNE